MGLLPVLLFVATACQSDAGTEVRLRAARSFLSSVTLVAAVTSGTRTVEFAESDFGAEAEAGPIVTPFVRVAPGRDVTVSVTLQPGQADEVLGSLTFHPNDGWGHDVVLVIADADPTTGCFGCGTSRAFPLPAGLGAAEESLWMYLVFDPRDDSVVF